MSDTRIVKEIVVWDEKYTTGIELIDTQHKQLINLTNQLYAACSAKGDDLQTVFKDALKRMVDYVHYHFSAELKLLAAIQFPDCGNHQKMHDALIKDILDAVKDFNEGKKFTPNNFVRTLVQWILSHIGFYDKQFADFAMKSIKSGALTLDRLKEIESSIA